MRIRAEEKMLLMRFANYKKHSFVDEHNSIVADDGSAWMLKLGRRVPTEKLDELFKADESLLLLKAPKDSGGGYYSTKVLQAFNGSPQKNMRYPKYYDEIMKDEELPVIPSLEGTWFRITKITALPDETVSSLKVCSNKKPVVDVLASTRSSTVYVYSELAMIEI